MSLIYLDYNRTTPVAPSVCEAMQAYWSTHYMLPGQEHPHAQAVGEALETAREGVAGLVGCEPFEIVFTSGATEANNLAIRGTVTPGDDRRPGHILLSALEHESVIEAAKSLESLGWEVETVPCDPSGVIDPEQFTARIRDETRLACLQLANPVLGTIQPVREVADACHNRGVLVHCDATQAFGKIPVDAMELRVDTLSVSGHKFYGPKGVGAIYVRRGLPLSPILFGEAREMGLRPGAENIPACIGLGCAATLAAKCCQDAGSRLLELRERLSNGISSTISEGLAFLCEDSLRLPNTVAIELPGNARLIQRSARQLAFATAQSASPPDEMTRALRSIERTEAQIAKTVRISIGWTTSQAQIDRAVELLADACDGAEASRR